MPSLFVPISLVLPSPPLPMPPTRTPHWEQT
uniref:Uncharacterized protein n=1 Tax=Rhizophora mucronata TaxID=61149 RepID=A0A2P2Q4C7_RHIMU